MSTKDIQEATQVIRKARAALAREIERRLKDFTEATGVRISSVHVNQWDTFGGTLDYTVDIDLTV